MFMYCGAIVTCVSVLTLINAVGSDPVSVITIPGAVASWAASTVNTLRPFAVPVSSSALEPGFTLTFGSG